MSWLPTSPRKRRRLLRLATALVAVGIAVGVGSLFWNTGHSLETLTTGTEKPAQETSQPKQVPLTSSSRRDLQATLTRFVATAVTRRNVAASYGLATPNLREGMSRKEWVKGDIPVYPYPARHDVEISRVVGSFPNDVLLEVLLQPRPGKKIGPIAFQVEMKAAGKGSRRRWRVDSFAPSQVFPAATPASAPKAPKLKTTTTVAKGPGYGAGHLSAKWFLVPALILALIVLVPIGLTIRSWWRARKVARAYEAERSLPELPSRDERP